MTEEKIHEPRRQALKSGLALSGMAATAGMPFWSQLAMAQGEELVPFSDVPEGFMAPPVAPGAVHFQDTRLIDSFHTPKKHSFCIYTKDGCWELDAQEVPDDVVGRLDCAILERELYPKLGLTHDMIVDLNHFDYYSESALDEVKAAVDRGDYDMAVALHPVSLDELMAVADAGLEDPDVVMPEKSTFFQPKILSGLFLYRY